MGINYSNILLRRNKEMYIDELISYLLDRRKNYDKILVTSDDNCIELMVIKEDMKTEEINKMLEKKDLSPEMRKALEERKKILTNDKEVKK